MGSTSPSLDEIDVAIDDLARAANVIASVRANCRAMQATAPTRDELLAALETAGMPAEGGSSVRERLLELAVDALEGGA